MSGAITRFEKMGVDVDMLVRRREGEHGIVAKIQQLDELLDPTNEAPTVRRTDQVDESFALRADINERIMLARQQTAHTMHNNGYSRYYLAEKDDTDVELRGAQVFGWLFANQVLSGAKPEDAARNAEAALGEFDERESNPLLVSEGSSALVIPAVSIGDLALTADLRTGYPAGDYIGAQDGDAHIGYSRTASRPILSWRVAGQDQKEQGIEFKYFPSGIFESETIKDATLGTKVLTSPEEVEAHLTRNGVFAQSPEIALLLESEGAFKLSDYTRAIATQRASERFASYKNEIARRALTGAVMGADLSSPLGGLEVLVRAVKANRTIMGLSMPSEAITARISREIKDRKIVLPEGSVVNLGRRGKQGESTREATRKSVTEVTEYLEDATQGLTYATGQENRVAFTQALLDNIEAAADDAQDRGLISRGQIKRIRRFVDFVEEGLTGTDSTV
jgi:hypothetical protein